jgi:hypothetical protein
MSPLFRYNIYLFVLLGTIFYISISHNFIISNGYSLLINILIIFLLVGFGAFGSRFSKGLKVTSIQKSKLAWVSAFSLIMIICRLSNDFIRDGIFWIMMVIACIYLSKIIYPLSKGKNL